MGSIKFCRVCLVPEENGEFTEIFDDNGKVALQLFNISGVLLVDIDDDFPAVICSTCLTEVNKSEELRRRILDANDHYQQLSASREVEVFKEKLSELKPGSIGNNKNGSSQVQQEITSNLKKFFVPKVYLNRSDPDDSELLTHKPMAQTKLKPTKSVFPMVPQTSAKPLNKVSPSRPPKTVQEMKPPPPPSPKIPAEELPKTSPRTIRLQRRESTLQDNCNGTVPKKTPVKVEAVRSEQSKILEEQTKVVKKFNGAAVIQRKSNSDVKRKKRQRLTVPRRNTKTRDPGVRIVTCFECDTCKRTFKTSRELNNHIESHELLVSEYLHLFETAVLNPRPRGPSNLDTTEELLSQGGESMQENVSVIEDITCNEEMPVTEEAMMQEEEESLLEEVDSDGGLLLGELDSDYGLFQEEVHYPMQVDTDDSFLFTIREIT